MNFKTFPELVVYFSDEKRAWAYWEQMRWNGRPVCPHCGNERVYRIKEGINFKCGNKVCDQRFNARVGTFFENTKVPMSKWFVAIYIITAHKKGISSVQLAKDIGVTQKTAWFMLHRIRQMVTNSNQIEELTGIVQVDETYVKGKLKNKSKKNRALIAEGKKEDTTTVVVGLVQSNGKGILQVVPDAKAKTLKPIIRRAIKDRKSVLVTDMAVAYNSLSSVYRAHIMVNHGEGEFARDGYHTNTVEGFFSLLKRGIIGIYHYVSPKHLQRYCDEFSYRYNTRNVQDVQRFHDTMSSTSGRLRYAQLIGKA